MNTTVTDICNLFKLGIRGDESKIVVKVASIKNQEEGVLMWAKSADFINKVEKGVLICSEKDFTEVIEQDQVTYLITKNSPRLMFSKIVQHYIGTSAINLKNEVSLHIKRNDIKISENCFIGPDVEIGTGTIIYPNVVIHSGSIIGKNCIIKSFCSIGSEGLGYEFEDGKLVKFPQLGGVVMGDNVEIGPSSTIRRAALDDTLIGDGCKIGSFVNVGHNCVIKQNVIMTCQIVTAGGSIVGKNVFMGVGSSLKQKVAIGDDATIGQGAVIIKDVKQNEIVVGNPGKVIGNNNAN
ncbi:hypothetical protein N9242_05455 [Vicingaceae bacterium]|nr:hypothetical protein [Vicingaceae bacterium]